MTESAHPKRVLEVCDEALALDDAQREAFLQRVCADDVALRRSVDSVLIAVGNAGEFLQPVSGDGTTRVGAQIGNYRLLEKLGEGGMGSVYLAERKQDGYTQHVAIKTVRRAMLAKELIRRFDAERKILAALNHPYIAQLIDGGTTPDGVPFLVMEYVAGVPIDSYCDANSLDVPARLRLLQKVATAVQAAHQNLIVHRDLKPSNVLITEDGIPKLLDFGIAKLIDPAADSGNTTVFGHQAMTPDYASPEQILEGKVTTASDVYTLGVLAYELITGQRPYHLETSSQRDMVRSVETRTVRRPSSCIGTASDGKRDIARRRATTPDKLARAVSGDLDTILMKALHKEPARRYDSVSALRKDIDRYLAGLPVEARDDTLGYRLQKFVSRHRLGVAAGAVTLGAIFFGLATALWQARIADKERAVAEQQLTRAEAVSRYLGDILLSPSANWDAAIQTGANATIGEVLDAAEEQLDNDLLDQPRVRVELYNKIGEARDRMEDFDKAIRVQTKAWRLAQDALAADDTAQIDALYHLANTVANAGRTDDAIDLFLKVMAVAQRITPGPTLRKLYIYNDAAVTYADRGEFDHALALQEQTFADYHAMYGDEVLPALTNGYNNLARYQYALGQLATAEQSATRGLAAHAEYAEQTESAGGDLLMVMGAIHNVHGRHDEAVAAYGRAADLYRAAFGEHDPTMADSRVRMAVALMFAGRFDEAAPVIDRIGTDFATVIHEDPEAWTWHLAHAMRETHRAATVSALAAAETALRRHTASGRNPLDSLWAHWALADARTLAGQPDAARQSNALAAGIVTDWLGPDAALARYAASRLPD